MAFVDDNGISCFVDDLGVTCWVDDNGIELCCRSATPGNYILMPQILLELTILTLIPILV